MPAAPAQGATSISNTAPANSTSDSIHAPAMTNTHERSRGVILPRAIPKFEVKQT
jgi:hypothetical protein